MDIMRKEIWQSLIQNSVKEHEILLYSLLALSGQRASEILNLKLGDIKDNDNGMQLRIAYCKTTSSKIQKARTVVIPKSIEFETVYKKYLAWRYDTLNDKSTEWLFVNSKGEKLSYFSALNQLRTTLCKSNISNYKEITLSSFRKRYLDAMQDLKKCDPYKLFIPNNHLPTELYLAYSELKEGEILNNKI